MLKRVKWFNDAKGYGFIENGKKEDIFVHYSAIKREGYKTLSQDQLVEFDLIETDKGYQAKNVILKEKQNVWKITIEFFVIFFLCWFRILLMKGIFLIVSYKILN